LEESSGVLGSFQCDLWEKNPANSRPVPAWEFPIFFCAMEEGREEGREEDLWERLFQGME